MAISDWGLGKDGAMPGNELRLQCSRTLTRPGGEEFGRLSSAYTLRMDAQYAGQEGDDVTPADVNRQQSLEILIDELVTDEEFRHAFLDSPRRTLQLAGDWGLPLCESEIRSLMATGQSFWDRVVEEVDGRLLPKKIEDLREAGKTSPYDAALLATN